MSAQTGDQVKVVERRHLGEAGDMPGRAGVADLADLARSEISLRRFLHGLPGVDQVGAEARAASLSTRSIKAGAKLWQSTLLFRWSTSLLWREPTRRGK